MAVKKARLGVAGNLGNVLLQQRAWTAIAAGAASAMVLVLAAAPGAPVEAAEPAAVQAGLAPTVIHRDITKVKPETRVDRRSVDTGATVRDGYALVWGLGSHGISGRYVSNDAWTSKDAEGINYQPTPVQGLPQGAIVEMAMGIYEGNAIDVDGCVWGWGWFGQRDGTGNTSGGGGKSVPPKKIKIGMRWDEGSKADELCNIVIVSRTEMAGAGVDRSGRVWSWGLSSYGGPSDGTTSKKHYPGAVLVRDLPDPSIEGNRPVSLEGGYKNFWVMLENGEVWYFGNCDSGSVLASHARPMGDQPTSYSGVAPGKKRTDDQPTPDVENGRADSQQKWVRAAKSEALAGYFRAANEEEYVVQVHSGIHYGAALLSTGRVLTWGKDIVIAALGRDCTKAKDTDGCSRKADFAVFSEVDNPDGSRSKPRLMGLSCSFTACFAIAETGQLWGWGVPATSYEFRGVLNQIYPVMFATGVTEFQAGQGYVIWWNTKGQTRAVGYNPRGSIGVHAGNWGQGGLFSETKEREVWFAREASRQCTNRWDYNAHQMPPEDADGDSSNGKALPEGWKKSGLDYYKGTTLVYKGSTGDYQAEDYILYKDSGSHQCHLLNNPANRLSWEYCVSETVKLARAQEGKVNPTYVSACA